MDRLKGGSSPSLLPVDAREKSSSGTQQTPDDTRQRRTPSRMACIWRTATVFFLCMLVLLGLASAGSRPFPCHKGSPNHQAPGEAADASSLSALLKSASLHDLLHRYFPDQFQDGVFPSDHEAIEALQRADPALASSILQLAKREESNSTTSKPADSTSTGTETTETSKPPASTTETPSSSSSSSSSSTSVSPPPSSTTTTSVPPSTTPPSSTRNPSTTPPSSSLPGTKSHTSSKEIVETLTSTHADGAVVTLTTTTLVPADETAASTSTRATPGLQNRAVRREGGNQALTGAVGAAMLLLLA
ncbi:hypothetical protein C8A05DRAFT_43329 [Staphylotrichum tortipilum]|uniref:Uncharacterized protein n=1 Tax=Staphylotrichum tortipilum TaxID=2831512 RepID=A0AAN6RUF2_9PEZI|nr:hypothetical protein C8A05DRAFT_43329 [Staphylotrichum longicolle]